VPRVGLVTALLPPVVGGTQILVWRLFRDDPNLVVVSGVSERDLSANRGGAADSYAALEAPTLHLPYPRLRGYRYGLAPVLGAVSGLWLARSLVRVVGFLRKHGVDHVVSIPHQGPFAILGLLAARRLGIDHTFYILDAWEEGATGPVERALICWALRLAARTPRSRLATVSPVLAEHYRRAFGFRDRIWIPNPAPLAVERPRVQEEVKPFVLFTGAVKPFNIAALRCVARSIRHCKVIQKLIVTGQSVGFADSLRTPADVSERVESRLCSPEEISALQAQAAVLLIATNVDDTSQTALGYLPGRLPEYVSTHRPILLIGPRDSDAARAVRHWRLGPTTASQDEVELARLLDAVAVQQSSPGDGASPRDLFLEVFSRNEARRRLLGDAPMPLSPAAAALAAEFELSLHDTKNVSAR
jgi:hypothetical protein